MKSLRIRDVVPADAEGICRVINPIIEAGAYTVFDAPFGVKSERDYIQNFPARGVWKVALEAETSRVVGWQVLQLHRRLRPRSEHRHLRGVDPTPSRHRVRALRRVIRRGPRYIDELFIERAL